VSQASGRDHGQAAEPTFVLLHGYAGSSYTWRYWAPRLTSRGRVLTVDLKGFGDAPKPEDGRYAPGDLADLVVALLRELDLRNVTLIGHSLGGGVALLTALRLHDSGEDRLARLVLIGSPAYRQKLPPLVPLSKVPGLTAPLLEMIGAKRAVRSVLRQIVFDPDGVTEEQVDAYARPLATREGVLAAMAAGRSIVPDDLDAMAARYPDIDVPALVLWGDHDRVVPLRIGERLASDLPNARLVVMERCGHVPPEEHPEASFAHLEDYLDGTGG
jgi:pimeloyl-ACP methyl ester carboxylesterase